MAGTRTGGEGDGPAVGWGERLLRKRFWIYGAILLILLVTRFLPSLRSQWEDLRTGEDQDDRLILAGLELAPVLIPRLAENYRSLYPDLDVRILTGGTRQALEDLFNRRANVAFLSRPLTKEEEVVVRSVGDTALCFPIALGGIAVMTSAGGTAEAVSVSAIRSILETGTAPSIFGDGEPIRLYAPDPNLGLWTALTEQLGLSDDGARAVVWLANDREVALAVAKDPRGIGIASLLALAEDLPRLGVEALEVTEEPGRGGTVPEAEEVATGEYPLYHYLYVACRPGGGALASAFVSYMVSGRGQRLVAREGFLPARDVPREIRLTKKPVTKVG